jgi:hypothetical protein
MNRLVPVLADGSLSDDVFILVGDFAISNPSRTFADLIKFLRVSKGVRGSITVFADKACTEPVTEETYAQLRSALVAKDLYFKAAQVQDN